jgi:NAD(P)-dependent dehydrogenase (short-subunit alcohol dehydrogenase family)
MVPGLKGLRTLMTGASKGIGRHVAEILAGEGAFFRPRRARISARSSTAARRGMIWRRQV